MIGKPPGLNEVIPNQLYQCANMHKYPGEWPLPGVYRRSSSSRRISARTPSGLASSIA
jgi:hypothetical protein